MSNKNQLTRLVSFILCFLLIFEQSGFCQIAGQLDLSLRLSSLQHSLNPDKFRPLHLRYLSYNPQENNFKLLLDKGDFKPNRPNEPNELNELTKQLLNYFFIGVSLPNESFWVNLRPDSPGNIIDPELAKTEIGRVLLEADLQLKKDTANYTNPQTLEGKQYWTKLYQKAEELFGYEAVTIPTLTRPWIVPGEIIIRETSDNAYIYKATLKVKLESDYLEGEGLRVKGVGYSQYEFKDPRLKALNEYSSQLIRELIIPKITKEVNTAKKYASLRQVYYSLVLAQWFKQKYYGRGGLYSWLINKQNLNGLTSKVPYSKDTYFKQYQDSFNKGEYNLKEPQATPFGQTIRSYFSGGADLNAVTAITAGALQPKRTIPITEWNQQEYLVSIQFSAAKEASNLGEGVVTVEPAGKGAPPAAGAGAPAAAPMSPAAGAGVNPGAGGSSYTHYPQQGCLLPAERFGGDTVDLLDTFLTVAKRVVQEEALVSIIGSFAYTRDTTGNPDWDYIDDIDLRIHTERQLSWEEKDALLQKLLEELKKHGITVDVRQYGIVDRISGRVVKIIVNPQPLGRLFNADVSSHGSGLYHPTEIFAGNTEIFRGVDISQLLEKLQESYHYMLGDAKLGLAESPAEILTQSKRLYYLACLRGRQNEFVELLQRIRQFIADKNPEALKEACQEATRFLSDTEFLSGDLNAMIRKQHADLFQEAAATPGSAAMRNMPVSEHSPGLFSFLGAFFFWDLSHVDPWLAAALTVGQILLPFLLGMVHNGSRDGSVTPSASGEGMPVSYSAQARQGIFAGLAGPKVLWTPQIFAAWVGRNLPGESTNLILAQQGKILPILNSDKSPSQRSKAIKSLLEKAQIPSCNDIAASLAGLAIHSSTMLRGQDNAAALKDHHTARGGAPAEEIATAIGAVEGMLGRSREDQKPEDGFTPLVSHKEIQKLAAYLVEQGLGFVFADGFGFVSTYFPAGTPFNRNAEFLGFQTEDECVSITPTSSRKKHFTWRIFSESGLSRKLRALARRDSFRGACRCIS